MPHTSLWGVVLFFSTTVSKDSMQMISCHVDSLLKDRGYRSRRQLALEIGMSPWALGFLARNKYKAVSFKTVEKLCSALQCQPGDIFTYSPDPQEHVGHGGF